MKKYFFILIIVISWANAQTVDGIKISDLKSEHIAVHLYTRFLSSDIYVDINYGQPSGWAASTFRAAPVMDDNKRKMSFDSSVNAINFLSDQGYELVTSITSFNNPPSGSEYYFFRRKISYNNASNIKDDKR